MVLRYCFGMIMSVVDIDDLQRRRDAFQRGELVHGCAFPQVFREGVFIAIGAEI